MDTRRIFYKDEKRTIYWEDMGSRFQVRGVVLGDGDTELALLLPQEHSADESISVGLSLDEWMEWLKYSDDPKLVITDEERAIVKAIVRKNERQIEEIVRWRIYKRDNFTCQYCGSRDKPLTVDHYLAESLGGSFVDQNLKTSCRPCNKAKGQKSIYEWNEYRKKKKMRGPIDEN